MLYAGITYMDTSADYGFSEEHIGKYVSHRRAEYYITFKCKYLLEGVTRTGGSRKL